MLIAVWIASGLLALAYLFAGGTKVIVDYDKVQARMTWTSHARPWHVKLVGILEILAVMGLIVPVLTGILPILAGVAAAGLVLLQVVAIVVHFRIGEGSKIAANIVLLLLALFVAIVRLGGLA